MKFTTAFYTLALSFAAVTGSADARIGQKMSPNAFESRMMLGTEDCGRGCCNGQICDPSVATSCGAGIPACDAYMETCTLQHPSGEYRCQSDFNGRKLGGDPNNTPDSDAPTCGEFEVVCDANIQALGVNCALLSCVDCTPLLVDSGVNCTPEPTADARIGQQMSTDAFESRMMSGTEAQPIPKTDLKCSSNSYYSCFDGYVDPKTGFWIFDFDGTFGRRSKACENYDQGDCAQFCDECAGGPAFDDCSTDGEYTCKSYVA